MKKIIYLLSSFALFATLPSCSKQVESATKQVVIDTEIAAGAQYQLNLASYGSVAAITKQASNSATSQISTVSSSLTYNYLSNAKATATDQVVLAVTNAKTSSRNCGPTDSTIVTINFSIK